MSDKDNERSLNDDRFWLGFWAIIAVAFIIALNVALAAMTDYPDGIQQLSTIAVTGVLAALGGSRRQ